MHENFYEKIMIAPFRSGIVTGQVIQIDGGRNMYSAQK